MRTRLLVRSPRLAWAPVLSAVLSTVPPAPSAAELLSLTGSTLTFQLLGGRFAEEGERRVVGPHPPLSLPQTPGAVPVSIPPGGGLPVPSGLFAGTATLSPVTLPLLNSVVLTSPSTRSSRSDRAAARSSPAAAPAATSSRAAPSTPRLPSGVPGVGSGAAEAWAATRS